MILLLDNYDSFTYNLYQFIAGVESEISGIQKDQIDSKVKVVRNDQITPEKILELAPEALVISPGPGKPSDAGICIEAIQKLKGKIPMLGVCLGHQAMAEAFGATVGHAGQLMHGKTSQLKDVKTDSVLFQNLTLPIQVARYHSLAVKEETLPEELTATLSPTTRCPSWLSLSSSSSPLPSHRTRPRSTTLCSTPCRRT